MLGLAVQGLLQGCVYSSSRQVAVLQVDGYLGVVCAAAVVQQVAASQRQTFDTWETIMGSAP